MKIEAGKYYRTRDGQKVGPMNVPPQSGRWAPRIAADDGEDGWYADGRYTTSGKNPNDIIAEWSDPVDLTAITTPFGLLDRETQEALKAHGGPYQVWDPTYVHQWFIITDECNWVERLVYRVKPAPAKPRTIYLCEVHGTRTVFDTAIAATREALEYQHGEARVTEWEEKLK